LSTMPIKRLGPTSALPLMTSRPIADEVERRFGPGVEGFLRQLISTGCLFTDGSGAPPWGSCSSEVFR
jgi:hypothetical protein